MLAENSEDNKEKMLRIAQNFEFLNENVDDVITKIYTIEDIKNIIFSNYYFIKIIKEIIKYKIKYKNAKNAKDAKNAQLFDFIYLIERLYSSKDSNQYTSSAYQKGARELFKEFFKNDGAFRKTLYIVDTEIETFFDGLLYYNSISYIINNDEELKAIFNNLFKTFVDNKNISLDYISKKVNDIYHNSYIEKYHIDIKQEDFENIFIILIEPDTKRKKDFSNFYKLVSKEYKTIKSFPKNVYNDLFLSEEYKLICKDLFYYYILEQRSELSLCEICEILLDMDKRLENYNSMVKKEKQKIKNAKEKEEKQIQNQKEKERLEQERIRLIKGDTSQEVKLNEAIEEKKRQEKEIELGYQNVENGYEFEEYVAKLYEKLGYKTKVTRKSGDQGADIIADKDNKRYVIQAKFYSSSVNNKAVQEVVASIGMYNADYGIVVTNNTYTSSAVELAKANNIELVDGDKIEKFKKEILAKI